jgi:hypothetical protein
MPKPELSEVLNSLKDDVPKAQEEEDTYADWGGRDNYRHRVGVSASAQDAANVSSMVEGHRKKLKSQLQKISRDDTLSSAQKRAKSKRAWELLNALSVQGKSTAWALEQLGEEL